MRRTWVDVADVVLGLALLVVAVLAGSDGRALEAVAALALGVAWGARGVAGLRRRAGLAPAAPGSLDEPGSPLPLAP